MSDSPAASVGDGSAGFDGAGREDAQQPPASLNVTKLRSQHAGSNESQAMSPTTSVKALLADTQAAPLPSPSSSIPEASTLAFDQQQAALRRRKTAGSTLKDGEDQVNAADRETGQSGKDDSKTPSPGALVDSKAKSGSSSHTEGARPTFQQTLQDLRQFLLHFLRILPCKGFQSYLKKIIGPIVRLFVRGVATILHRGQYGLASNVAFDIHLLIWKWVINLFFREIRPRGAYKIPRDGPLLLVAGPHHNQFLDPLLLMSEARMAAGRRVSFLIAEKSYHRKFVGLASKIAQAIPVARASDNAKTGKGTVYLDPSSTPEDNILKGSGTQFTKEFGPKYQLQLGKQYGFPTVEVVEIIDDETVKVKKMYAKDKIIADLKDAKNSIDKGGKGLPYKCLPYIDQTKMYSSVYKKFSEGGCIGIFPEGGSHDRTDFLPLKHGLAIMALGAMAANPECKVKIVPVGLNYFHPHKFRSRAVIEFGAPITIPESLVETFAQGGQGKRDAIGAVMDLVFDGLKSVTVRAPDFETLMVIQASRRLYKPPGQQLNLSQVVELNKRFIMGYNAYRDEPKVQQLYKHVEAYNKNLSRLGLKDHQVEAARRPVWKSLLILLWRTGLISAWTIMALPGIILNAPIFIAASIISHRKAKEAVAASTVKLEGRDVLATWKVLVSLGMAPVLYSFYTVIAMYFVYRYNMGRKYLFLTPLFMLIAVPSFGYSALRFGEVGMDIYKSLPPLFMSLFPWHQQQLERIRQQRRDVTAELTDCIEEFAPRLWKDFESHRMIPPSSATEHSYRTSQPDGVKTPSGASATRKSTFGSESSILQHPMSWIDEKVFGWSTKSTPGGRRKWSSDDGTASDATPTPSEPVTPAYKTDESEEDTADYDEVVRGVEERLAEVNGSNQSGLGRLRRRSSARSRSQLNVSSTAPVEDPVESESK